MSRCVLCGTILLTFVAWLASADAPARGNVTVSMTVKHVSYLKLAKHGSPWLPRFNSILREVIADEAKKKDDDISTGDVSLALAPLAGSDADVVVWVQIHSRSAGALRGSLWASANGLAQTIAARLASTHGFGKGAIAVKNLRVYQSEITAWTYKGDVPMGVRATPKLSAKVTGQKLESGTSFHVSEERRGSDGIRYLKLGDGSGWVFEKVPGMPGGCVRIDPTPASAPSTDDKQSQDQRSDSQPEVLPLHPAKPGAASTWWRYVGDVPFAVRETPLVAAHLTGDRIQPQTMLHVTEERRGADGVLYLKLARGWVFEKVPGMGNMCVRATAPGAQPKASQDDEKSVPVAPPKTNQDQLETLPVTQPKASHDHEKHNKEEPDYSQVKQWRYIGSVPLAARREASYTAPLTGVKLQPGGVFRATEQHRGSDAILYLKLDGAGGWVFEKIPGMSGQCVPYAKAPLGSGVWRKHKAEHPVQGPRKEITSTLDAPYQPPAVGETHDANHTRNAASSKASQLGSQAEATTVTVQVPSQGPRKEITNSLDAPVQVSSGASNNQRAASNQSAGVVRLNPALNGSNSDSVSLKHTLKENASAAIVAATHGLDRTTDAKQNASIPVVAATHGLDKTTDAKQNASIPVVAATHGLEKVTDVDAHRDVGGPSMHIPWMLFAAIAFVVAFGMVMMQDDVFQSHVWPTISATIPVSVSALALSSIIFPCLDYVLKESADGLHTLVYFGLAFALFALLRVALTYSSELSKEAPSLLKVTPDEQPASGVNVVGRRNETTRMVSSCAIPVLTCMAGLMAARAGVEACVSLDPNANLEPSAHFAANGDPIGGPLFPAVLAPIFLQQALLWAMFAVFRIARGPTVTARSGGSPDMRAHDDNEYSLAEDIVAGLSFSFLAVQTLCLQLSSGTEARPALALLGGFNAVEPPVTQRAIASMSVVAVVAAVGMLGLAARPSVVSPTTVVVADDFSTDRLMSTAQIYLGMIIVWCSLYAVNAEVKDMSSLDAAEYNSPSGQFLLALVVSAGGLLIIYCLSKLIGAASQETSIRTLTTVLGLLLGLSWGSCFDSVSEAIADATPIPFICRLIFLAIVAVPLVYIWCQKILPMDPNCSLLYSKVSKSTYHSLDDRKFNV